MGLGSESTASGAGRHRGCGADRLAMSLEALLRPAQKSIKQVWGGGMKGEHGGVAGNLTFQILST